MKSEQIIYYGRIDFCGETLHSVAASRASAKTLLLRKISAVVRARAGDPGCPGVLSGRRVFVYTHDKHAESMPARRLCLEDYWRSAGGYVWGMPVGEATWA